MDFNSYRIMLDSMAVNPVPLDTVNKITTSKWLMSIETMMKELVTYVETFSTEANEYTDNKIAIVNSLIQSNYTTLNNLIQTVKTQCNEYTDTEIIAVKLIVTTLSSNIAEQISTLELKDSQLDDEITALYLLLQQGVVYVIDPTSGVRVQIQVAVDNLYSLINSTTAGEMFTAELYETLNLTAEAYELLQVTARGYDRDWYTIFFGE